MASAGSPVPVPTNTGPSNSAAFTDDTTNINQAQAAALAALAAGGTAGLQAHLADQAALTSDRSAAVQAQLAAVQGAAAPAGAGAALGQALATPYDQYAATNNLLQTAGQQADAQRSAAANTYFNEAASAVPIIRAQAEGKLALARQAAAASAQTAAANAAYNMQLHQLALDTAQANLAHAQATAAGTSGPDGYGSVDKILASLGGPQIAGQNFNDTATRLQAEAQPAPHLGGTANSGPDNPNNPPQLSYDDQQAQAYGLIDQHYNLPPGTAQNIATQAEGSSLAKASAAAKAAAPASKPPSDAEIRNNGGYSRALSYATALWNVAGSTQASVVGALTQYAGMSPQAATLAANDTVKDRPKSPNGGPAPLPGTAGAGY